MKKGERNEKGKDGAAGRMVLLARAEHVPPPPQTDHAECESWCMSNSWCTNDDMSDVKTGPRNVLSVDAAAAAASAGGLRNVDSNVRR